jgi:putative ABC transport system permease protein
MQLKKGISINSFIKSLNQKLNTYGITAVDWRIAAGNSASMVLLTQALFNTGIFLVSIVGVIAIINILFISIFRRIKEIGTLRAIGAPNKYIRSLIYTENLIVSFIAGITGILGGILFLRLVNSMQFIIKNDLVSSILNGPVLYINFNQDIAIYSFLVAVLLGFIASVYPVETAVRLEPVVAVQRG